MFYRTVSESSVPSLLPVEELLFLIDYTEAFDFVKKNFISLVIKIFLSCTINFQLSSELKFKYKMSQWVKMLTHQA